ncbi:uncharacterized protein FIBRA_06006 [Fibroporia radiculosa]|uniref:AIG1-type G domain-containing protein n=1 Tax=Fibroporia radiculosa TaxID=599839 RepID=J4HYF6_9APHY|nr:uncharacterized protein FIBRA_06006 [Fibroporia radiculosa]CCM03857.1 predicted protein [Fibroporia radiculosa]
MPSDHPPTAEPKLIIIMGATGSGKSTFANLATGADFRVGHGLQSCTETIQQETLQLDNEVVTIIDTPGFDDTERPQADVLREIADFLKAEYENKTKVAGVVFTYRISDHRMSGVSLENYRLFRKICGDMAMENVAVVTTMWTSSNQTVGMRREKELSTNFFKDAIENNARMYRHDNTQESAKTILRDLMGRKSGALRVQVELVDQHKSIPETEAGTQLQSALDEEEKRHNEKLEEIERERQRLLSERESSKEKILQEMETERRVVQDRLSKVLSEKEKLRFMRANNAEKIQTPQVVVSAAPASESEPERPWWRRLCCF